MLRESGILCVRWNLSTEMRGKFEAENRKIVKKLSCEKSFKQFELVFVPFPVFLCGARREKRSLEFLKGEAPETFFRAGENRWNLKCGQDKNLLIRKVRKLSKWEDFYQLFIMKRKLEWIFKIFTGFSLLLHQKKRKSWERIRSDERKKNVERKINWKFFET